MSIEEQVQARAAAVGRGNGLLMWYDLRYLFGRTLVARCIKTRPVEEADRNEEQVFRALMALDDDWLVLWGYRYTDASGEAREGDFLVLGPKGGLLVVEVKGRTHLQLMPDGSWGGGFDNPFHQLDAQWSSVIEEVNRGAGESHRLTVCRALATPNVRREALEDLPFVLGHTLILTRGDLRDFRARWDDLFGRFPQYPDTASRQRFLQSRWGQGFSADAGCVLSDYLDCEIDRLTRATFPVLDHLPAYNRFAITGCAGSGKTWMLLELALRWAGRDGGPQRRVLLLCYNRALEQGLDMVLRRLARNDKRARRAAEHVTVMSWESIVAMLMIELGIDYDPPAGSDARDHYYKDEVPAALELALGNDLIRPRFDALVVDEAQDHNTVSGDLPSGWWSVYERLLDDPATAPFAVAYDSAQRPSYWDNAGRFIEADLLAWLGPGAVRLHCPTPRRYTRQIAQWLADAASAANMPFQVSLAATDSLPDGFEVEAAGVTGQDSAATADAIAARWIDNGWAAPDEILVIGVRNDSAAHGLGPTLGGHPLVPVDQRGVGQIGYVSAGRCKGLESLAVIVIGFGSPETLKKGYVHSWFLAVSRARQLLAVLTLAPKSSAAARPSAEPSSVS